MPVAVTDVVVVGRLRVERATWDRWIIKHSQKRIIHFSYSGSTQFTVSLFRDYMLLLSISDSGHATLCAGRQYSGGMALLTKPIQFLELRLHVFVSIFFMFN